MLIHCTLAAIVSEEKSVFCFVLFFQISVHLYMMYYFSLAAFKISFLSLVFTLLAMMCIGLVSFLFFLEFVELLGSVSDSIFLELENIQLVFLQICFSRPFSLSFISETNYIYVWLFQIVSWLTKVLLILLFQFLVSPLFTLDKFYLSVFQFNDFFFFFFGLCIVFC